ncbi:hypothetical protein Ancab_024597 [Ancistrocladus abbreviatus]
MQFLLYFPSTRLRLKTTFYQAVPTPKAGNSRSLISQFAEKGLDPKRTWMRMNFSDFLTCFPLFDRGTTMLKRNHQAFPALRQQRMRSMGTKRKLKPKVWTNIGVEHKIFKVSAAEAERFCDAFRKVYHRLVYEEFSVEAAQSLLNSS